MLFARASLKVVRVAEEGLLFIFVYVAILVAMSLSAADDPPSLALVPPIIHRFS